MPFMPNLSRGRLAIAAAVVAAVGAGLTLSAVAEDRASSAEPPATIEPAFSRPCEEAKLAFPAPGVVSEVLVREGDVVKAGQVLMRQDDAQEQQALHSDEAEAKSTAEIVYEQANVKLKAAQYKRKKEGFDQGQIVTLPEVEEAEDALGLAEAQVAVSELHHAQKNFDFERQKDKVAKMQRTAPFDGIVQRINTHVGEMADPQNKDGALIVVKNDPLYVEVHPSTDRAAKLTLGQELQVRYTAPAGEPANPWMTAKIWFFAPQADAGSKTERVQLSLPNPTGLRSGLAMEVKLPGAGTAAPSAGGLPPLSN